MALKFDIYQSCTEADRPPISYRVREYLVKFITDHVLEEKRIIVGGKWDIRLAIFFSGGGPKVLYTDIGLAKGSRSIKAENIKLYEVFMLLDVVRAAKNPY